MNFEGHSVNHKWPTKTKAMFELNSHLGFIFQKANIQRTLSSTDGRQPTKLFNSHFGYWCSFIFPLMKWLSFSKTSYNNRNSPRPPPKTWQSLHFPLQKKWLRSLRRDLLGIGRFQWSEKAWAHHVHVLLDAEEKQSVWLGQLKDVGWIRVRSSPEASGENTWKHSWKGTWLRFLFFFGSC